MASTSINRTPASAGDMKKWTFSIWLKRAGIGAEQAIFSAYHSSNYYGYIRFNSDDTIEMFDYETTERYKLVTNRKFRDVGAWYHIVVNQDVENGTSGDRLKIWINGIRETSFSTANYPATTVTSRINNATPTQIGAYNSGSYFNGEMSHIQFVNAESLAPTEFGEFDSTSGIWKLKTEAYATPGTNGFFLKMEDRTNLDLDSSSNAYTFTTTGTITPTYDNPSNNFATFNPLTPTSAGQDLENGNLYCPGPNSPNYWQSVPATLGARAGKWYWEFKDENSWGSTSDSSRRYGICDLDTIVHTLSSGADVRFSGSTSGYAYMNASGVRYNGGTISGTAANYPTFTDGDIIQVAMDLDNQKLYFGKNGTWLDSSDPTSGATGTGSVADISATATWSPYVEIHYGSDNVSANFGNGYFKTTSTGTTEADDAGIGQFKYDVPAGYYALCTKNIKAYG